MTELISPKQLLKLRATSITILPAVFRASEDFVVAALHLLLSISRCVAGGIEWEFPLWRTKSALCMNDQQLFIFGTVSILTQ